MLQLTKKLMTLLEKRQKVYFRLIIVMMLVGGLLESLGVSLILPLISAVMSSSKWDETWYGKIIGSVFSIESKTTFVTVIILALIFLYLFKNVFLLFEYYLQNTFCMRGRLKIQRRLMFQYTHKPYEFYLSASSGDIIRVLTADTTTVFAFMGQLMQFYTEAIVAVILVITVFVIDPIIASFLSIALLGEVTLIYVIIKPITKRYGDLAREKGGLLNKWILQTINGIKSVKVSNREKFFENNFNHYADQIANVEKKYLVINNVPRLTIEAVTVSAVLAFLLIFVSNGTDLSTLMPQLTAFGVAAIRLLPSVNRMATAMNSFPYAGGALDNVIANLDGKETHECLSNHLAEGGISFNSNVTLSDISYKYPTGDRDVLHNANVVIQAGQSVGLIGASGAGKTTAVDIILGLLEPQNGAVFSDGVNISNDIIGWRNKLAYIPQQIFLLDDSIRNNVIFGSERIDDDMVWDALKEAQLDEFVKSLPQGLDTSVGEQGIRLSGGQRQRIGIARALYTRPQLLIFDEATSALDNDTEAAIMESINSLKGHMTMIIIAHRLTTIANCDVVYRVEDGKIMPA